MGRRVALEERFLRKHRMHLELSRFYLALYYVAKGYSKTRACEMAGIRIELFNKLLETSRKRTEEYWEAARKGGFNIIELEIE